MKINQHSKTEHLDLGTSNNSYQNNFGDIVWKLEDEDGKIKEICFLDWNCNEKKILWAQSFVFNRANGYVNSEQKIVISDTGTWNPIINKLKVFCEYWESNLSAIPQYKWTQKDVVQFIKKVMIYTDDDGNKCVKHHGQEEGYRHILYLSYQYFTCASIIDGLRVVVNRKFSSAILEPYIKNSGISLAAWLKGGTHGTIPIENGMVVLASALELLQSNQANAARSFYHFMRENQPISPGSILSSRANFFTENRVSPRAAKAAGPVNKKIINLKKLLEDKLDGESPEIFIQGNLSSFVMELYAAASYILLILSGFRLSEWVTFKAGDFERLSDGTWKFCNQIHKTNHSIQTPRYLHGMAAVAIDTLIECSYLDKVSENAPVFLRTFRLHHFVTTNKRLPTLSDIAEISMWGEHPDGTIRAQFNKFYNQTIKLHIELAEIHNTATPHQARHLWAHYSIRRFDGAVIDLITEHFRHRYSDNFIRSYYEDALRERERDDIEMTYIEDIMRRIGGSDESVPSFYGAAAKRARNELRKAAIISSDDFELVLASLVESIIITVDEWGYCLLRRGEENLAKCWNKSLGIAMVEESRSFEICGGCPHSCNTKLQRHGIERSLIAHEEFVEKLPPELSRLTHASKKYIKIGEMRLGEMNNE